MVGIASLSISISLAATLIGVLLALAGAFWIVYGASKARFALLALFNAGLGLPPVAVGLAVAFLFWRSGPLGWLDVLYTPAAMILAQTIVVTPLIGSLAVIALRTLDVTLPLQLAAVGIAPRTRARLLLAQALPYLAAAGLAGFGRALAEVGAAQMTGGNIEGQTRVLTTATMLAVGKADFALAFDYVSILLGIMMVAGGAAVVLQARWR